MKIDAEDLLLPMFVLVAIAAAAAIIRKYRQPAPVPREGVATFGPLEQVGDIGNVDPLQPVQPIPGRPGEVPGVDFSPPDPFAPTYLTDCRLRSRGDFSSGACFGVTWSAIPEEVYAAAPASYPGARRLPTDYVRGALLDPRRVWYGYDLRDLPTA